MSPAGSWHGRTHLNVVLFGVLCGRVDQVLPVGRCDRAPVNSTQWVCRGPVHRTDWCVVDNPDPGHLAPGGVVLCLEGTLTPHPDAARAAASAWEILTRWQGTHHFAGDSVFTVPTPRA